jgi:hypothetical protein
LLVWSEGIILAEDIIDRSEQFEHAPQHEPLSLGQILPRALAGAQSPHNRRSK